MLSFSLIYAQKMSYEDFKREANINKRLLPKYGKVQKSDDELAADKAFIERSIQEYKTVELASKAMVKEGYSSLKKDPKQAMINFNQAYLLDSSNADIYWGYGKLYSYFEQYELADAYYQEGLNLNSKSVMLLNSIGENYITLYKMDEVAEHLDMAIKNLQSAFMNDPSKCHTTKLLTEAYLLKDDCEKARKYYQVYQATEMEHDDPELTKKMEEQCLQNQ